MGTQLSIVNTNYSLMQLNYKPFSIIIPYKRFNFIFPLINSPRNGIIQGKKLSLHSKLWVDLFVAYAHNCRIFKSNGCMLHINPPYVIYVNLNIHVNSITVLVVTKSHTVLFHTLITPIQSHNKLIVCHWFSSRLSVT